MITITEQSKNNLLGRTRVQGTFTFEKTKTISNTEAAKEIASSLKVKEPLVVMRNIYTHYGSASANFKAYVYDSPESLKTVEIVTRKKREADKKTALDAHTKKVEERKAAKTEEKKE